MAEIIDFKVEKKRILKKWEAEIEDDIKAQDWYIEAKRSHRTPSFMLPITR